jgi:hypothetical protein
MATWQLIKQVDQLRYFHAADATAETLAQCEGKSLIFEVDVAITYEESNQYSPPGVPYIGHSPRFYGIPGKVFSKNNVTLEEFKRFVLKPENQSIKVLLDIKNVEVLPHVLEFVQAVGKERCMAHAFILDWTGPPPPNISIRPHWVDEDVSIEAVDKALQTVGIPLIANCRGYNDNFVIENNIIQRMITDAKKYSSIAALGIYYPQPAMPPPDFLRAFNEAGYKGWVNANMDLTKFREIRWVGMSDDLSQALLHDLSGSLDGLEPQLVSSPASWFERFFRWIRTIVGI